VTKFLLEIHSKRVFRDALHHNEIKRVITVIYHIDIKIISRGKGKSAVAAAAYRAGEKITNPYEGITHDYTRKIAIIHSEIMLSENAPIKYSKLSIL